jgi:hypothetical protein
VSSVPTEKQYARLRVVANPGSALISGTREFRPLIRRGWLTPTGSGAPGCFLRITPAGLRALAGALERHGYPGEKVPA